MNESETSTLRVDSVEPTIELQVQTETSTNHSYLTRSKERQKEHQLHEQTLEKQRKHNVVVHPRLKPVPFKKLDLKIVQSNQLSKTEVLSSKGIRFYQIEDHPVNKRGFKYKSCRPNPVFTSNLYSTTELPPFLIRPSFFDRSQGVLFSDDLALVSTVQGWRSTRTNIGIRQGKYYFEFNIINSNEDSSKSHVRIGLARKEASLEAPVGFDGYSYGLRDVHGELMNLSRPHEEYITLGFKSGDTIGFLVDLPTLDEHRQHVDACIQAKIKSKPIHKEESPKKKKKIKKGGYISDNSDFYKHDNIARDQIPIKYKNSLYYEQYEYTNTKTMEHLLNPVTIFGEKAVLEKDHDTEKVKNLPVIPNSKITIFKNGVQQEHTIENLYSFLPTNIDDEECNLSYNTRQQQNPNYRNTDDGSLGYYPMLSVFQGGIVGLNAGPEFKYPPKDTDAKPLNDRFNELVVEEWYWDLIDEVEAEYLDSFE
jgi:COMPASS component BRE2